MYIRVKKVKRGDKTYEYAHLVNGQWKKRRIKTIEGKRTYKQYNNSVHKYKGIIGKVYRLEKIKEIELNFYDLIMQKNVEEIYNILIENELKKRGFEENKGILIKDNLHADLKRLIIHDGKKDAVIKLQEKSGYLCSKTLEELHNIKNINGRYEGLQLLKKLRMIGIKLKPEEFYLLAQKMVKN